MQYDVILMLYFPKMVKPQTPTPGDSDEEDDYQQQLETFENNYTPFLMELHPKSNQIKLFFKPLVDENDEDIEDNHNGKRK